jgi:cytochrome P450
MICRAAFGSKRKDQDEFLSLSKQTISLLGAFELADLFPSHKVVQLISGTKAKLEKMHMKMEKILESIIHEHREDQRSASPKLQEDLVDVVLRLQQSGTLEFPITTDNINAVILVSISAIILIIQKELIPNDFGTVTFVVIIIFFFS